MYFTAATAAMSVQQIAGPTLNGSAHQIEYKCTTAKTVLGASDFVTLTFKLEGLDLTDLRWGTASAIPATFSLQFKAPIGLYHLHIQNRSGNRHIAIPINVTVANTEARYDLVVPGDTSGTWTVDNDTLLTGDLVLAAGATLTGGSASTWSASTFYAASTQFNILSLNTNVVRVGDFSFSPDPDATGVAPAWVPMDFGNALRDSQRYYYATPNVANSNYNTMGTFQGTTTTVSMVQMPVTMRAAPSFAYSGAWEWTVAGGGTSISSFSSNGTNVNEVDVTGATSGGTQGQAARIRNTATNSQMFFNSRMT